MSRTYTQDAVGKKYHTIFDGRLVHRVPEGTEGAIQREKSTGGMVWEIHEGGIIGYLKGLRVAKKEIAGKKIQEVQLDIDEDAMVQVPLYLMQDVAEYIPNIDITKEIKLNVFKNKKGKTRIQISQEDVAGSEKFKLLEAHYTEWEQDEETKAWKPILKNGIPEIKYDKEEDEWDGRERDKFLKSEIRKYAEQMFGGSDPVAQVAEAFGGEETDEPLPF